MKKPHRRVPDPVAAYEAAGGTLPTAEPAVTVETIRPLLREKGVLWGREALARYGVKGFGEMTPAQLTALHAELTYGSQAAVFEAASLAFIKAFVAAGGTLAAG